MDPAGRLWDAVEPYMTAEGVELDDIEIVGREGGRFRQRQRPAVVQQIEDLSHRAFRGEFLVAWAIS